MARRKRRGLLSFSKRENNFNRSVYNIEKEIDREIYDTEDWIFERRKFLKKLCLTIILVLVLLLFLYLIEMA